MNYIDITGFQIKTKAVERAAAEAASKQLTLNAQECYQDVNRLLSGPSGKSAKAAAGQIPIPRPTGTLARSWTLTKISSLFFALWNDPRIAPYSTYVHFGTRKMKARPYLQSTVEAKRQKWANLLKYQIILAIRRVGT